MKITQSKDSTPQLSLIIKTSIDAVWSALRDKEKLLRWHGWDTPGLAAEIESIYFTNVKEEITENKHTLVVNGGDTFIAEAAGDDTRLTLIRAGLSGDPEWDGYYDNITEGWVSFIEQLRFMLERAPKSQRKAEFTSRVLQRDEIVARLNLAEDKEGAKFTGSFEGNEMSGEVWFSTPNQLGLLVDGWGPGLLILQFSEKAYIATRLN